jgi:phage baseplate assembly protein W
MSSFSELNHTVGGDLVIGPTGDLSLSSGLQRSQQRILRRLLTNPGDYIWHPTYGAGLPSYIGTLADLGKVRSVIRQQMLLEDSVAKQPEPQVAVTAIQNGLQVSVRYQDAQSKTPAILSFNVNA